MDEKVTKPTIETVLERMGEMEERTNQRMEGLELRLDSRLDRIESVVNITRGEMLDLRADFRDLRVQLKEHFPALR